MARKKKDPRYTIKVTEKQMKVILRALERFFRLQMGQFFDYTDEVALNGFVYNQQDPENKRKYNEYLDRRDRAKELFDRAFCIACPKPSGNTEDMLIAEDMWSIIRHQFWKDIPEPKSHVTVDSYPPFQWSGEEPITITKE